MVPPPGRHPPPAWYRRQSISEVTVDWLGKFVIRRRWLVLGLALAFLPVAGLLGGSVQQHLSSAGLNDPASESARAERLLQRRFRAGGAKPGLPRTAPPGSGDHPEGARA